MNYPKNLISFIVQLWPLGIFPFASGTFCSIIFSIIGYYVNLFVGWEYTLSLSVLIIDEAAGQLIASAAAGINIYLHLLSFILFRFFDISKLGPIRLIENRGGAFGIMFDDVLAGIFTALTILIIVNFFL